MGDRLTEENELPGQTSRRTYGDIFDELFPHYLLMGMTPEQYWDGESSLKPAYLKAYRMRMDNEQKMADRNNWLMGQYMMHVLNCMPLLVAGFNVKPTTDLPEYPKKPFLETAEEMQKEEERKKKEEDQTKLVMAMMQARFAKFNKNFEEKKRKAEEKAVDTGQ